MKRLTFLFLMFITGIVGGHANFAVANSGLDPAEIRGKTDASPMNILQNRFFLKTMRPEIGLFGGTFLNEAYTNTRYYGVRTGLFFTEWIGLDVQYLKTSVSDSADRKALNQRKYRETNSETIVTPDPEVNPVNKVTESNVVIAPFYGKLNLLNKYIIYSDLYVSLGLSNVSTLQGDKTGLLLGCGQRFYVKDSWSVRIDYRNRSYTETRAGQNTNKNAMSIDLGLSYFFL